ncbi:TIGR04255 family protein [Streptomyces sp. NPDC017435]|uniref:TIGR04255 family protein n=1 Tax=Streptomyces sp. NPDC017435 TaxID=3364995 RepID=UPI0037990782
MFDFLPGADVVPVGSKLLRQALVQVRFNSQGVLGTHSGVSQVHDALAERYPRLTAEQQVSITATPGSGVQSTATPQYRFQDLKGSWAVVLGPEHATLETSAYTKWEGMRERLEEVLSAVSEVATLRVRERIGIRYVNHIPPAGDGGFEGRVRREILGVSGDKGWRSSLVGAVGQVIAGDGKTQMALRHGLATDESLPESPYLVDIDCSNSEPLLYDMNASLTYLDELNDVAYRCFSWCVEEDYRKSLTV